MSKILPSMAIADACFEKDGPFPELLAFLRRLLADTYSSAWSARRTTDTPERY